MTYPLHPPTPCTCRFLSGGPFSRAHLAAEQQVRVMGEFHPTQSQRFHKGKASFSRAREDFPDRSGLFPTPSLLSSRLGCCARQLSARSDTCTCCNSLPPALGHKHIALPLLERGILEPLAYHTRPISVSLWKDLSGAPLCQLKLVPPTHDKASRATTPKAQSPGHQQSGRALAMTTSAGIERLGWEPLARHTLPGRGSANRASQRSDFRQEMATPLIILGREAAQPAKHGASCS